MTKQGRRILVADDHPLIREGLALAMRAAAPDMVVDMAGSIAEAEDLIARHGDYRLVLLDLVLPDARGFSGFLQLQKMVDPAPIALLSAQQRPDIIKAARALGAIGYLSKSQSLDRIVGQLRTLLAGEPVFSDLPEEDDAPLRDARARVADLSGAQFRVLIALADGKLNKQIAGDLGVTEATVKAHLTAIFRKLGVINRMQAILAIQPLIEEIEGGSEA